MVVLLTLMSWEQSVWFQFLWFCLRRWRGPGLSLGYSVNGAGRQGDGGLLPEALRGGDRCTKCSRIPEPGFPLVFCVGCGMRACEVCCPMPARLCESCRITSCTPIGALISTVVDKDRFHHKCNTIVLPAEPTADKLREWLSKIKERVVAKVQGLLSSPVSDILRQVVKHQIELVCACTAHLLIRSAH